MVELFTRCCKGSWRVGIAGYTGNERSSMIRPRLFLCGTPATGEI
jgi:hypothetical protein